MERKQVTVFEVLTALTISEMSVGFYQTIRHYISDNSDFQVSTRFMQEGGVFPSHCVCRNERPVEQLWRARSNAAASPRIALRKPDSVRITDSPDPGSASKRAIIVCTAE